MDNVFDVIDKHMSYHKKFLVLEVLTDGEDLDNHASALSALYMLKMELKGEVEY